MVAWNEERLFSLWWSVWYQQVKVEHQMTTRLLQPLPILEWKWEHITMDFVIALPHSQKGNNAVWVTVDHLIKSARTLFFLSEWNIAEKYLHEVVRLKGGPVSIVLDRNSRFLSHFWKSLRTRLKFNIAYHQPSDGQSEQMIQSLEDMLRVYMLDFKGSREDHLHLTEFSYNNSY